jgi:hypothetical protein
MKILTNAEALEKLSKLAGSPRYLGQSKAARMVSEETGAEYLYLYWLPRMRVDPEELIKYTPNRRAAVEHTKRKIKYVEN